MAEEFRIDVPFGASDQLTPQLDRAERRMRQFTRFMQAQSRIIDRTYAGRTGWGQRGMMGAPTGGSGRPSAAATRFAAFRRGGNDASRMNLYPMGGAGNRYDPAGTTRMTRSFSTLKNQLRQVAPLAQRAFAPFAAAGFNASALHGVISGGPIGRLMGSNMIAGIGMGGGLARAGAPFSAAGRVIGGAARGVGKVAGGVGKALSPAHLFTAGAVGYVGAQAAGAAFGGPMALAGQMEQAQITFETLTGSVEEAQKMMKYLFDFAEKTPLRFGPIREWGQALLQWGFAAERIPKLMTAIASAASAMPEPEVAGAGITRALGQMRLRGRVLMEEINQLQDQGVPALEMLAKAYGVSTNEIIKWMETGARPAVLVGKQLRGGIDIITEGIIGRYPGMLEKQSKTLLGLWNTIQDIVQMRMVLPWGQGLAEGVQPVLQDLVKWFDEHRDQVAEIGNLIKDWGKTLSTAVAGKVREIVTGLATIFGSEEWKSATTFGQQFGIITGKIGELLWGTGEGNKGLVQGVMDWAKDRAADLLAWGKDRWTDFSNMVGEKIQTWTTWTAERINELKAEFLKRGAELVDYFKGTFQDTIVNAIKTIIPWFKPGTAPGASGIAPGSAPQVAEYYAKFPLNSKFMQPNAVGFGGGQHRGIDIGMPAEANIYSPVAGKFGPTKSLGAGYGRAITVIDEQGNWHIFGHTAGGALGPEGGAVKAGQLIGTVGDVRNKLPGEISTGTHLHYEIRKGANYGDQVNPSDFLAEMLKAPEGAATSKIAAEVAGTAEGNAPLQVEVGEVHVHTEPHEDPAAVNEAVADGFAGALAGALEGAFGNMPHVTR